VHIVLATAIFHGAVRVRRLCGTVGCGMVRSWCSTFVLVVEGRSFGTYGGLIEFRVRNYLVHRVGHYKISKTRDVLVLTVKLKWDLMGHVLQTWVSFLS
jgi:hypothetical protein